MARTIILLLDSFGIGYAHDAEAYGDKGADTLGHICDWLAKNPRHAGEAPKPLHLPHLAEHGLQAAAELSRGERCRQAWALSIQSVLIPMRRRSAAVRIH